METYAIDGRIRVTSDYGKFKRLEGNRDVLEGRKSKIIKSIKSVGYIPSPIVVNDKMEIIDGAGRYEAAKQLELPIYYVVVPRLTLDHCIAMNVNSTNWTLRDYVKSYAEMGDQSYVDFQFLMDKHPTFSLLVIASTALAASGTDTAAIKNGGLSIDHSALGEIDAALTWVETNFPEYGKFVNGSTKNFYCAVIWAYRYSSANRERLASVIQMHKNDLPPITTIKYALEQISKLYNKSVKTKRVYLNVEYDKWCADRLKWYKARWGYAE